MSGSLSLAQSFDAEVESIGYDSLQIIHPTRCAPYDSAYSEIFFTNSAISPVVAALRVHALSRGNWYWVLPVCLLGMMPVGTNIWFLTQETWTFIPRLGCTGIVSMSEALYDAVVITTRASVIVSDILVVAATWYYICRTSAVREHLARGVWAAKPNITTVMFRNGTLYFIMISLLNVIDLVVNLISISSYSYTVDITDLITAMTSILISHFLICIREAAERSIQAFTSQSLSFIDSQSSSVPRPWLSSMTFAADIANSSARDSNGNNFSDLEDDLDLRGEDDARDADNDAIELEPLTSTGFDDQVHALSRAVLFIHVLFFHVPEFRYEVCTE
ncbi:hypothetical protein IEO21_07812 [Rhodonia placenta]|uniref:Uncharacterized protein n=1 Tax=Rhodonia placenta TaxID=104341 RepID=A0A8H7NXM8_9APHY|nr:hypothetical protein IEO21_07812 [Postia placenta]